MRLKKPFKLLCFLSAAVEIEGDLYLAAGAVLDYREFNTDKRLNDEEWQKMLADGKAPPPPLWIEPVMLKWQSPQYQRNAFSYDQYTVEYHDN